MQQPITIPEAADSNPRLPKVMKRRQLVEFILKSVYFEEDATRNKLLIQQRIRRAIQQGELPANTRFETLSFMKWAIQKHGWNKIGQNSASPIQEEMIDEQANGADDYLPRVTLRKMDILEAITMNSYIRRGVS